MTLICNEVSLPPETKRSSSNYEFRCVVYYNIKACKVHLVPVLEINNIYIDYLPYPTSQLANQKPTLLS